MGYVVNREGKIVLIFFRGKIRGKYGKSDVENSYNFDKMMVVGM